MIWLVSMFAGGYAEPGKVGRLFKKMVGRVQEAY